MAHYVYTNDGSRVPDGVRVFENRFGFFEDKDGRQVTSVKDEADSFPLAPAQDPSAYTVVNVAPNVWAALTRIEHKLDDLLSR